MKTLGLLLATGGYAGYAPVAPGTAGSAVGIVLLFAVRSLGTPVVEVGVLLIVVVLGVWASNIGERHAGRDDPGFVVIDEIAGMLLTMLAVPLTWATALVGFLAFRLFDIVKPYPARRLERLHGGVGIMADDLAAAVYAAVLVRLVLWVVPGVATV